MNPMWFLAGRLPAVALLAVLIVHATVCNCAADVLDLKFADLDDAMNVRTQYPFEASRLYSLLPSRVHEMLAIEVRHISQGYSHQHM